MTERRSKDSSDRNGLSRIKGMGPKSADALRNAGVRDVVELARFQSPTDLHEHLLEKGVLDIPLSRIKQAKKDHGDWVTQAKRLQRQRAGFTVLVLEDKDSQPPWTIKTWHDESNDDSSFDSTEPLNWANWVLAQAQLPLIAAGGTDEESGREERAASENRLDVVDLAVTKAADPRALGDRLSATATLQLSGPKATAISRRGLPFRLEFLARNDALGTIALLGSSEGRIDGGNDHSTIECTIALPDVGDYRLVCAPACGMSEIRVESAEGPNLSVVERSA